MSYIDIKLELTVDSKIDDSDVIAKSITEAISVSKLSLVDMNIIVSNRKTGETSGYRMVN